jgi:hypothetical protein
VPGPTGRLYVYADKDGSGSTAAKRRALVVVGGGHEDLKGNRSDADLDNALNSAFQRYLPGYKFTIRHVASPKEMTDVISSASWDAVIYFGHAYEGREQALLPSGKHGALSRDDLIKALRRAGAKKVLLFGCESAATGLARRVSKELPDTSVLGMSKELEATWATQVAGGERQDTLTFNGDPAEYVNGKYVVDGKVAARRPHENLDPVDASGGPGGVLDDSVPNN